MTHQLKTLKKDFMTMKTNKDHSLGITHNLVWAVALGQTDLVFLLGSILAVSAVVTGITYSY